MKLNAIEKFEVGAEAFRIMTGHMAPGKDAGALAYSEPWEPWETRDAAYQEWAAKHGECVRAMFSAFERMVHRDGDEDV